MDPVNKLQGANKLRSSEQFVFGDIIVQRQNGKSVSNFACDAEKRKKKRIEVALDAF